MSRNKITIANENVLLDYLYSRLDKGITEGINEKDYLFFLNALLERINTDNSAYAIRVFSTSENFSTIAKKAINKTKGSYNNSINGLDFKNSVIFPNYNLRKIKWNDYKSFVSYGRGQELYDETISEFIQTPNLSVYQLKKTKKNIH